MSSDPTEVLSAFLDGEETDPGQLAAALARPGAREALLDFVELRAGVRDMQDRPRPAFYESMSQALEARDRVPWWRRIVPVPIPVFATAAVMLLVAVLWIGLQGPGPAAERPPKPDRVVRFRPGVDWQFPDGAETTSKRSNEDETHIVALEPSRVVDPDAGDDDRRVVACVLTEADGQRNLATRRRFHERGDGLPPGREDLGQARGPREQIL